MSGEPSVWHVALRIFMIVVGGSALSGGVAFLGNKLGRHVGRRKMTIFGLRPKYTSNLITVGTGCLIFMATLGIMSMASSDVRQLLVGLQELEAQRKALQEQVTTLERKVQAGPACMPFQPLAVGVIKCGLSESDVKEQVDSLLGLANDLLIRYNNDLATRKNLPLISDSAHLVTYDAQERNDIIAQLQRAPKGSTVVCIVLAGKQVPYYNDTTLAQFLFQPNPVVLHKGQVITSSVIDGRLTSAQVYRQVYDFIYKDLNYTCLEQYHMVRNPLTKQLDTSIDSFQMKRAADQILKMNKPMRLEVVADSDIHPLGPLDAHLIVVEK